MYQVYENFIVWLLLWTPWDNGLRFNIEDGLDQTLESFFWEAIAPINEDTTPWQSPDLVIARLRELGMKSRLKVIARGLKLRAYVFSR